jgi:O-antigen/teichoic acid export membrane protein
VNNVKRVAGNLFSLFSGEAVSSALAFVITILLARRLSDEGFGRLAFVQSIMVYLVLVVDLGLSTFGTREIARKPEKIEEISTNIFSLRLTTAGLMAIFLAMSLLFWPMATEMRWLYFGVLLGLFTQALNPEFLFQGSERMLGVSAWRVLVHLFYLILVFILVVERKQLWVVTIVRTAAEGLTIIILSLLIYRHYNFRFCYQVNFKLWKRYLKESLIMAASVVVIKLYYTFDTFMLGIMDRPETVGWYQAGYKVVLLFIGLAGMVQMAFGPIFARTKSESLEVNVKLFATMLYLIAILSTSFLVFLNHKIIYLLFGIAYSESSSCLALLAYSMFFVFIGTIFMAPLLFIGRHKQYLKIVCIGAIINIILNLVLIPIYSYNGAAFATIISNFAMVLVAIKEYYLATLQRESIIYITKWVVVYIILSLLSLWYWGEGFISMIFSIALTLGLYTIFNTGYLGKIIDGLKTMFNNLLDDKAQRLKKKSLI